MMFSDSVLFAWMDTKDKSIQIKRVVEDRDTQKAINHLFCDASSQMVANKIPVEFDGKYTPDPDGAEYLFIGGFSFPEEISSAIQNPQALEALALESDEIPKIKALFVGTHSKVNGVNTYTAAFQKFKSDQYISAKKIHLFLSGDTFVADKRIGLTVGKHIDCLFFDGKLQFTSFFFARQIFDLSDYYREATNSDIVSFIENEAIAMDDGEAFSTAANSWERRKIASIMDSGILKDYTATKIKSIAKQTGIELSVKDKKIVIPADKKERRIVLGFLDEEVYKGAFSQTIYQTNSKRKAK
ncbi:MAG: DUF4868 domain-containing protein [Clostridiales bacterium]|nr:DUF4868 domain-containing protein [Clostridiales bacterium]